MKIITHHLLYAMKVSTSNHAIRLAKHQGVSLANLSPVEIMHINVDKRSPYLPQRAPFKSVSIVRYKPMADRFRQIDQYVKI